MPLVPKLGLGTRVGRFCFPSGYGGNRFDDWINQPRLLGRSEALDADENYWHSLSLSLLGGKLATVLVELRLPVNLEIDKCTFGHVLVGFRMSEQLLGEFGGQLELLLREGMGIDHGHFSVSALFSWTFFETHSIILV